MIEGDRGRDRFWRVGPVRPQPVSNIEAPTTARTSFSATDARKKPSIILRPHIDKTFGASSRRSDKTIGRTRDARRLRHFFSRCSLGKRA